MKNPTLCTVASSSGGHILPALIASQQWHTKNPQGSIIFCTGTANLDKKILEGYPFITSIHHFYLSKFSLKKFWLIPLIAGQMILSFIKSFWIIIHNRPHTIISTGGLIAIPICYVGRFLASRIEIYELNIIPGKAVKMLLPVAHTIFTPFEKTREYCSLMGKSFAHKCVVCPYPLRFSPEDKVFNKKEGMQQINVSAALPFTHNRKTLFILGGSQGSLMLNNLIKDFIVYNPEIHQRLQIIHQKGTLDNFDWKNFYLSKNIPAFIFTYLEDIKRCYQMADLIICRAGAGTLFEIEFFEKPCIVIPLVSTTTDHQVANAQAMAEKNPTLFTVVEQKEVMHNPKKLNQVIINKLFASQGDDAQLQPPLSHN